MSALNIKSYERLALFPYSGPRPPTFNKIFETVRRIFSSFVEKITPSPDSLFNRVFYFSLLSTKRSQLKWNGTSTSSPFKLYDTYADIMRGHCRAQGTCPLRAFASIESLTSGQTHIYQHNARVLVTPRAFEEYYGIQNNQSQFQTIHPEAFNQFPEGQIFLFARPLPGRFSKFINRFFGFQGHSSQLSHFCVGIKIKGEIYVYEINAKPAPIFEKLQDHQVRIQGRNMPQINLFLPVGQVHETIELSPPK